MGKRYTTLNLYMLPRQAHGLLCPANTEIGGCKSPRLPAGARGVQPASRAGFQPTA